MAIPGSALPATGGSFEHFQPAIRKSMACRKVFEMQKQYEAMKCWSCEVHQRISKWSLRCQWHDWTNESMKISESTNQRIHEPMNEWISESMNQWSNEAVDQWINESMDQWISESVNQWTNESMIQWTNESVKLIHESMNQWTNEWTHEWNDRRMDEWMDAWMALLHWATSSLRYLFSQLLLLWTASNLG